MVVNFIYTAKKLSVKFTNLSQDVPEGSSVLWNFGDGSTSDEYNPSHDYENSGYYRVSLTITSNDGKSDGITQLLVVSDIVDTSLSNSIYVLIDTYIPSDIFGDISAQEKRQFIQKWQLYIQPYQK